MNKHPWFSAWQSKNTVNLPVCTDVLSYISSELIRRTKY